MSGMQPKVAMARSLEGWHAARNGHPSSHIIKPCTPDAIRPAHAEAWVMRLARRVGLTGHEVSLEWFGDIPAVVIERFDREPASHGGLTRLHQEDAAQALGLPWGTDAKFEGAGAGVSLRGIARLLDQERTIHTLGVSERERLLAQTVFRLLIGDTDGHAKDYSLLHDEQGGVTLAPLYDATPLVLYGGGGEAVALFVAGRRSMRTIDADALVHEAGSWGLDVTVARDVVMRTAEETQAAAAALEPDEPIADHLPGYVTQACEALRNGRPVSLGLGKFPLPRPIDVV